MREQHLDLLSIAPRLGVGFGPGDLAGHVTRAFVEAPGNLSRRRLGAALRFRVSRAAIARRGAIEIGRVISHQRACRPQEVAGGSDVALSLVIESEAVAGERAVVVLVLVEDGNVRLDAWTSPRTADFLG